MFTGLSILTFPELGLRAEVSRVKKFAQIFDIETGQLRGEYFRENGLMRWCNRPLGNGKTLSATIADIIDTMI